MQVTPAAVSPAGWSVTDTTPETAAVPALAADHGLDLRPESLRFNEMGLDFRVVLARTTTGEEWVLRIPRRAEVMVRAAVEARVLRLVAPHLSAAVPDWRIHTGELIAYPLLPGEPGLEMVDGEPVWRVDVSSPGYADSLGELLTQLHGTDPIEASTTGAPVRTPAYFRQAWRDDIERVSREFTVAGHLRERWESWLADESYWPDHAVLTHGEIYPGHTLIRDGRISAVLDWTTATVGDPGRDFMFHQATASPEAFRLTVDRYTQGGGKVWPRLAEHCAEMFAANPVAYGLYVLDSGDESHREAAAAQLNPSAE
jgi:macrolide phosphotransferase